MTQSLITTIKEQIDYAIISGDLEEGQKLKRNFDSLVSDLRQLAKDLEKSASNDDRGEYANGHNEAQRSAADRINEIIG